MDTVTKADILNGVFSRWESWVRPQLDREQTAYVLEISLGLGALFNEDKEAERTWMRTKRQDLDYRTPLTAVLSGDIKPVVDAVRAERNIY